MVGGYVAQHYGWRNAFILVCVVSLLLGPICLLVLKEPRAKVVRRTVAEPYLAAFVELFKSHAYRCILCAIVIFFFMGYGALVFIVSLLTRLLDLDLQTAGATFGRIALFGAIFCTLHGGIFATALARINLAKLPRT